MTTRIMEPNKCWHHFFDGTQSKYMLKGNKLKGIITKYNLSKYNIDNQIEIRKLKLQLKDKRLTRCK